MSFLIMVFCLFFGESTILAAESELITKNKYFDAVKLYPEKDFALNDTLEFAVFDLSEITIINDAKPIPLSEGNESEIKKTESPDSNIDAYAEVDATLKELPKYFYMALNQSLLQNKVPVVLYPSESPDYASPLSLYIKIKRIHLKPVEVMGQGGYQQVVALRIYGQLKNKKTDAVLIKFYDSEIASFLLGQNAAAAAMQSISEKLMRDFALFLQSKY